MNLVSPTEVGPMTSWRVALCLPSFQPLREVCHGKITHAAYLQQAYIVEALQARGHALTLIAPRSLFDIVCSDDLVAPTPAKLGWTGRRWFDPLTKAVWRLQKALGIPYLHFFANLRLLDASLQSLPGHDLVQERNSLYRVGFARAAKRLKLPYILFFDGDPIFEADFVGQPIDGLLHWRAERMMCYSLEAADAIICVCEQAKAHLGTTYGIDTRKIVVFPNGVDVQRFRPQAEVRDTMRASLGIGDAPLLLFVGAFYPWHDVQTLLRAFGQVLKRYPEARLWLVGDGEQRQAMQGLAAELGLLQAVEFTGLVPHDRVPQFINAADVAVAPFHSRQHDSSGSPTKIFEYLASGAPIVASSVGQVAEVIREGVNGLLVPPQDASALATALERLIGDPELRARLGRQAREDAMREHSWERYAERLERLYATVLAGEPVSAIVAND